MSRGDIGKGTAASSRSGRVRGNLELVRELYAAFGRRDDDAAFALYDPGIEWDATGTVWPEAQRFHGHAGVRSFWKLWLAAWDAYSAEPEAFIEVGDDVLVDVVMRGTGRGSGVEIVNRHAQVWTIRDGLVVRVRFSERDRARRSLGLPVEGGSEA